MRTVVLDTNVIVSAAIEPLGVPSRLVREWVLHGRVHIVTSPAILAEYREVMRRPKFSRYGFPPVWLDLLIEESVHVPDPPDWPFELPDPDDAPFLSAAYTARACLVTGNMRHFPERLRRGVEVFTPAQYLRLLSPLEEPS
jgi:putative PIN family toxin of toxin-antitoxin system